MVKSKGVAKFSLIKCVGGYRISCLTPADAPLVQEMCGSATEFSRLRQGELQWVVGDLMVFARRRGFEIEPKGLLRNPVLHLKRQTPVPLTSPFQRLGGRYAAKWGLSDFYEEHEQALREVLENGSPFDTGRFGAKKEIEFGQIVRMQNNGPIEVTVRCEADDGVAAADTAFWRAAGGNDHCSCGEDALAQLGLSEDEVLTELENLAEHIGEINEATASATLPAETTMEQLCESLDRLVDECGQVLDERYENLKRLASQRLEALKSHGGQDE